MGNECKITRSDIYVEDNKLIINSEEIAKGFENQLESLFGDDEGELQALSGNGICISCGQTTNYKYK